MAPGNIYISYTALVAVIKTHLHVRFSIFRQKMTTFQTAPVPGIVRLVTIRSDATGFRTPEKPDPSSPPKSGTRNVSGFRPGPDEASAGGPGYPSGEPDASEVTPGFGVRRSGVGRPGNVQLPGLRLPRRSDDVCRCYKSFFSQKWKRISRKQSTRWQHQSCRY